MFSSAQFSRSVVSNSLWPHKSQHARPPCQSPTPGVHSDSRSSTQWCHPAISSSVIPYSSCPQSLPTSKSFRMRWPKYWSFSFSIVPSKVIPRLISFRMDWLGLLAVQGTLKSLLQHHSSKASILQHSAFFTVQLSQPYMTTGKTIALTRWTLVSKVMSLLLNMLLISKSRVIKPHVIFCRDPAPVQFSSVQFSSVTQLCPTLCDPMNHSTPGLPVHHHLPEFRWIQGIRRVDGVSEERFI